MIRFSGAFFWAIVVGVAMVALGCPSLSVQYFSDGYGKGGGTTTSSTTGTTSTTATTGTGGTGGGVPCSLPASPCVDDGNPCTGEACTDGFCTLTPLTMDPAPGSTECMTIACTDGAPTTTIHGGDPCGTGLKCNAQGGCSGCMNNAQCGETNACQTSTCLPDMTCDYVFQPIGTPVVPVLPGDMPKDCMSTICNGSGVIALAPDAMDVPDALVCNNGQCLNGAPVQKPLAVGTPCAGGATFCNASQTCVVCTLNAGCATGTTCYQETGCVSCGDGVKNGDETDVDCGGSCNPCADKLACVLPKDCVSTNCKNGTCISCFDGVKNGGEAEIDCGGTSSCLTCPGTSCFVATECALGFCVDTVCCEEACTDPCKSCNLAGKAGLCSNAPLGLADPACPSATPVCQTGVCVDAKGKFPLGATCTQSSDCFSNNCQGTPKTCK